MRGVNAFPKFLNSNRKFQNHPKILDTTKRNLTQETLYTPKSFLFLGLERENSIVPPKSGIGRCCNMEESTDTAQKSPVLEGMQLHQGRKWNCSCKNHGLIIVGTVLLQALQQLQKQPQGDLLKTFSGIRNRESKAWFSIVLIFASEFWKLPQ